MKKISLLFIVFLFSFQLFSQSKVGTIDVEYILAKMPELAQVETDVNAYGKELEGQAKVKFDTYQVLIKEYQEKESSFTEADKLAKQNEIIDLEKEMQQFRQNSTTLIQIRQNELLQPLYKKIGGVLETIAGEQGFTQIFTINNTIAYLDPKLDLTIVIMEKLGIPIEE